MHITPRAAIAVTLAAPSLAQAQSTICIRFARSLSTIEPTHQVAEFFAKDGATCTNGRVVIEGVGARMRVSRQAWPHPIRDIRQGELKLALQHRSFG